MGCPRHLSPCRPVRSWHSIWRDHRKASLGALHGRHFRAILLRNPVLADGAAGCGGPAFYGGVVVAVFVGCLPRCFDAKPLSKRLMTAKLAIADGGADCSGRLRLSKSLRHQSVNAIKLIAISACCYCEKSTFGLNLARFTLKNVFTLRTLASWVNSRCASAR